MLCHPMRYARLRPLSLLISACHRQDSSRLWPMPGADLTLTRVKNRLDSSSFQEVTKLCGPLNLALAALL